MPYTERRNLQVRSIRLDTRAWEASVLSIFHHVGNTASNSIWEAMLNSPSQPHPDAHNAAAVANWAFTEDTASDDDDDEQ